MAAAPDPDEVLTSTREKENFQRLARLLISGGTSLMREIFDKLCLPSNLPTILKNPAVEKKLKAAKLTKPQWDCLYPSTGVYGKSADFDVTLLFRLLRTICSITPPVTGWDALPTSTDHSLAAEIVRIKYYRNSVYGHVSQSMEITDDKFPKLWKDIREALLGIAGQISPAKKTAWQDAIDNFLKDPLTAEDERNVQELLRWYRKDIEVKEYIETSAHEMREGIESLEISVREEAQDIKDQLGGELKTTSQEVQSLVREEARDIKDQLGRELKTTSQEIKDQLGEELKTTSEDVQSLVREEAQGIKDQLGEMQQSIDRLSSSADCRQAAQIRLRIDCEAISGPGPRTGSSENKNVADGLAWGYYFGYLKLVLPKLEEQIGKSDEFRYKITTKKLFILLPKTCYTYDDIEHADDRVKWAGNLPECKINRGGIKARSYKHAVYRIEMPRPDGGVDKYHFVLEYATPLMNLYDMSTHADAPLSRQERDHQVVLFMQKLTEILDNSPECRGKYQLVPISGTETNKIADVLVTTYNNPNIELADAN